MRVDRIEIKGFGPYNKEYCLDLKDDITAIVGANGSGKTFLVESIFACLYGTFPSYGSLNSVVTNGSLESYIKIEFYFQGAKYSIKRSISDGQASAYLYKDGEKIAGPKVTHFDIQISSIVPDKKILLSTVFSSQNRDGDIVDAKASERKDILSKIIGIDRLQAESDKYSEKLKECSVSISNAESNINALEDVVNEGIENDIDFYESKVKGLIETQDNATAQHQDINDKLLSLKTDKFKIKCLLEKKSELSQKVSHLNDTIKRVNGLKLEVNTLPDLEKKSKLFFDVKARNEMIDKKNKSLQKEKDEARIKIAEYERDKAKIDNFNAQIEGLEKVNDLDQCKGCKLRRCARLAKKQANSIDLISNDQLEKIYEIISAPLYEKENSLEDVQIKMGSAIKAKVELSQVEKLQSDTQKDVDRLKTELLQIPAQYEINMIDNNISELSEQLGEKQAISNSIQDEIHSCKIQLERLNQNKEIREKVFEYQERKKSLLKDKLSYEYLKDAFSKNGIQALLIDSVIPQVEAIADDLITRVTNGTKRIYFSTLKELKSGKKSESLEINIEDSNSKRDIHYFSGGERTMLKTIIRITLSILQSQRSSKQLKTVVLDEAFDALDSENTSLLMKILSSSSEYFERLILITHSDRLIADLPNKVYLGETK